MLISYIHFLYILFENRLLSNNKLKGSIPTELGKLSNLKYL